MAIVAETFAAPDDGSIFEAAALHAEQAWHPQHPGRQAELSGTRAALGERRAAAAPQQLKRLLDTVVEQILVESRARIQPYFVAPTVRPRPGSRRRVDTRTNLGVASPSIWVTTRTWGRVS
jgi:hypothetical protein